ncbi:MAG: hypothetical protein WD380_12725 [Gaiellaceae bacterium]
MFRRYRAGIAAALVCSCLLAGGASGAVEVQRTQLGVLGSPERFASLTGQRSSIRHSFIGWHQPNTLPKLLHRLKPVPMLAIKTGGMVSSLDIATGKGDAFLLELNRTLAAFGDPVYVRPMPEMNGHWNEYSAFNRDGSSRGRRYSTAAFRGAFARIAVLARGGPRGALNAKLRKLGQPGIPGDLPATNARLVWNPQGFGSPNIAANSAQAYYPGDAYVDVVANDLYDQGFKAAWDANESLWAAHRDKPFGIAEWGLWGIDDPAFVERMAAFVKSHGRIEFLAYFSGRPGSVWDLASKPRSRAAYRRVITPLGR